MMANDFYKDFEELEDLIEDAFHIPLFKGKVILDESRFFDIMDNIRQSLPVELKQAKEVIANKETMMNRVKEDSDIMKVFTEDSIDTQKKRQEKPQSKCLSKQRKIPTR